MLAGCNLPTSTTAQLQLHNYNCTTATAQLQLHNYNCTTITALSCSKCNNTNLAAHVKQSTTQDTTLVAIERTFAPTYQKVKIEQIAIHIVITYFNLIIL
jgi:hypothetical protein